MRAARSRAVGEAANGDAPAHPTRLETVRVRAGAGWRQVRGLDPAATIPIVTTLRRYERGWLAGDLLAGLTVTALAIPQALAYGQLAGAPAEYGLYAVLMNMLFFAVFSPARLLMNGPDTSQAVVVASQTASLTGGDAAKAPGLNATITFIAGAAQVVGGRLRLGFLSAFLSRPVLLGYIMGTTIVVISSQLPRLFGIALPANNFITIVLGIVRHLNQTSLITLAFGIAMIVAYVLVQRRWPRFPMALAVVAGATVITATFGLYNNGVAVIGAIPGGLPRLSIPSFDLAALPTLLPAAVACAILGFADSTANGKAFALHTGEPAPDTDALAITVGISNIGASLVGGQPTSVSTSRTAAALASNAHTQVAQLAAAVATGLVLLFLTPLLTNLPRVALAAVVIVTSVPLLDFPAVGRLWHTFRYEAVLAVVTLLGVAIFGVIAGLVVAVLLSLADLIRRSAYPNDAVLAPSKRGYAFHRIQGDESSHRVQPGLLVYRFDGPLFFANSEYFCDRIRSLVAEQSSPVRWVVVDAEGVFYVDATGAAVFGELVTDLKERGIHVGLARLRTAVRRSLQGERLTDLSEEVRIHRTVRDAVQAFQDLKAKAPDVVAAGRPPE